MSSFGTILSKLDENAKRHADYYDYAASNENGEALDCFLALPQLENMDRGEKFVNFLFFEGLAWECNHADKPLDVVHNVHQHDETRRDFAGTSRAEMWSSCLEFERLNGKRCTVHLVPRG